MFGFRSKATAGFADRAFGARGHRKPFWGRAYALVRCTAIALLGLVSLGTVTVGLMSIRRPVGWASLYGGNVMLALRCTDGLLTGTVGLVADAPPGSEPDGPSSMSPAAGWWSSTLSLKGGALQVKPSLSFLGFSIAGYKLGGRHSLFYSGVKREVVGTTEVRKMEMPVWMLAPALGAWPLVALIRGPVRRHRRRGLGQCLACGYDLTGNTTGICSECATAFTHVEVDPVGGFSGPERPSNDDEP